MLPCTRGKDRFTLSFLKDVRYQTEYSLFLPSQGMGTLDLYRVYAVCGALARKHEEDLQSHQSSSRENHPEQEGDSSNEAGYWGVKNGKDHTDENESTGPLQSGLRPGAPNIE